MAKSVNLVILMGRLTRDLERRTTASGKKYRQLFNCGGSSWSRRSSGFFNITAWEKLGDLVVQYLSKGRRVLVQGRLRQDSWEDKETGKSARAWK